MTSLPSSLLAWSPVPEHQYTCLSLNSELFRALEKNGFIFLGVCVPYLPNDHNLPY